MLETMRFCRALIDNPFEVLTADATPVLCL